MIYTPLDYTGLLEPQKPHALKLLNSLHLNGIACDLSETGVGKTYAASWIAKQTGLPIVVICPKSVKPTWEKVLGLFGVTANLIVNYEKLLRGGTPYLKFRKESDKVNPKTGQKDRQWRYQLVHCKFPAGSLVIVDEAHKCKGTTSLNAGLLISLKRQNYKILTLSATQATNPIEMRAFGYVANLHDLYGWHEWCIDNGAVSTGKFMAFDTEDQEAQQKMKVCHNNMFNTQEIASRLTRVEMGTLFPDNHISAEAHDLGENNPKIQAVYDEMEDEIAALEEQTENYSGHVFAVIMKARRRAEMLKIPLIHEMIEDDYDEGKSIVTFLNFTESIVALSERLSSHRRFQDKIGYIYGQQSQKQRWKDEIEFQSDIKRILLCNLKAGGVALSFHDLNGKYPRTSIISPSFSAVDVLQALGRCHRQGGKTPVYQRIVYACSCVEERACHRVQSKLNNLECLNDGDMGLGFQLFS